MIDLHLRAESEADLAAALPMMRTIGEDDVEGWIIGSLHHALDAGIVIVTVPAVLAEDGAVTAPAVLADGFHANLRLLDGHPDRAAIVEAAELFRVTPIKPQRVFA